MIEIAIPESGLPEIERLVEEREVLDMWTDRLSSGEVRVRLLARAEKTDGILKGLGECYGSTDRFRGVILPVEAAVPAPPPAEEETPKPSAEEEKESRISLEELHEDVMEGSELSSIFIVMTALSALVAAIGLIRGSVAVIIGAMVIAPLLGPNVALALASTLGDLELARKSARSIAAAVAAVLTMSIAIALLIEIDPSAPEILSRTEVGVSDVILAGAAGVVGTLAFTTGLPTALVGVMVAVALLPPLTAAGLLLGSARPALALRAGALFLINVSCINLAGVVTFFLQHIRPRNWWEERRAKKALRLALMFWVVFTAVLVALILVFWSR